jgi:hypothetical protein
VEIEIAPMFNELKFRKVCKNEKFSEFLFFAMPRLMELMKEVNEKQPPANDLLSIQYRVHLSQFSPRLIASVVPWGKSGNLPEDYRNFVVHPYRLIITRYEKKVMANSSVNHGDPFTKSSGRLFQIIEKTYSSHREDFFNILSPAGENLFSS